MIMKSQFIKIPLFACLGLGLWSSCKKDYSEITYKGGTAPVLTATKSDSIPLPINDSLSTAVSFYWTNPNYMYSTGPNTIGVNYYLEFDTLGANFTNPKMQQVAFNGNLNTTFTVSQLNALLGNGLQLVTFTPHTIQVRVVSFLPPYTSSSPTAASLYSDTINYTVVPYTPPPAVQPPSNDSLYIVGSAVVADNWANPMPPNIIGGETFTRLSHTHYTITIDLVGSGEYKLVSVNGSWNEQWGVAIQDSYPSGGPFVFNAQNFQAPSASGKYTIDVNFQTGIFAVTAN